MKPKAPLEFTTCHCGTPCAWRRSQVLDENDQLRAAWVMVEADSIPDPDTVPRDDRGYPTIGEGFVVHDPAPCMPARRAR